jgi:hypothetical protein
VSHLSWQWAQISSMSAMIAKCEGNIGSSEVSRLENSPLKGPPTEEELTPSNLGLACSQTVVSPLLEQRWLRVWWNQ